MPKCIKRAVFARDIRVIFEGATYTAEISKHFSPSDIYRAIHKVLPSQEHVTIIKEHKQPLPLRYENLKTSAKIFAHRLGEGVPPSEVHGVSGRKATQQFDKVMRHWEVKDSEDILPPDLRPRVRPAGHSIFATREDVQLGIQMMHSRDWPLDFITALQNLSKVSVGQQELAMKMLRGAMAERRGDGKNQYRKVFEVMTADIRKAAERRKKPLEEIVTEADGVRAFVGELGESLEEVEKEIESKGKQRVEEEEEEEEVEMPRKKKDRAMEEKGKGKETDGDKQIVVAPRTFVIAFKSAHESEEKVLKPEEEYDELL